MCLNLSKGIAEELRKIMRTPFLEHTNSRIAFPIPDCEPPGAPFLASFARKPPLGEVEKGGFSLAVC